MESLAAALAALRLGSFSAAALELGLTHAAVSRRVAIAEEWAGAKLFERHGRGVTPTPNGQRVLARVEVSLSQISNLGGSRAKRSLPMVRVAVTPAFARFWLLPKLRALESDPADVRVEVVADLKHSDLVGGEVDLAIRYGRGRWHIGDEQKLFEEPLVPVIAQSLRNALPARLRPKDLMKWPLLHSGDTSNWQSWMEAHGQLAPIKAADRIFLDYALALDAAANGLGIALWNRGLHKVPNGLVAMDGFAAVVDLAYYLISRRGDTNSPAAIVGTRILRQS